MSTNWYWECLGVSAGSMYWPVLWKLPSPGSTLAVWSTLTDSFCGSSACRLTDHPNAATAMTPCSSNLLHLKILIFIAIGFLTFCKAQLCGVEEREVVLCLLGPEGLCYFLPNGMIDRQLTRVGSSSTCLVFPEVNLVACDFLPPLAYDAGGRRWVAANRSGETNWTGMSVCRWSLFKAVRQYWTVSMSPH